MDDWTGLCDKSNQASGFKKMMMISDEDFERIAAAIHSDSSPVGIDAKKTHVMLIYMVERLQEKLDAVEKRLAALEEGA